MEKKRVLILCTGNSARSQMAEGLLRHDAGETFNVESAGTNATTVRPEAIAAMRELEIDISGQRAKNFAAFEGPKIRLRHHCLRQCPPNLSRILWSFKETASQFDDPPPASQGTDEEGMAIFRGVRDELRAYLRDFVTHQ